MYHLASFAKQVHDLLYPLTVIRDQTTSTAQNLVWHVSIIQDEKKQPVEGVFTSVLKDILQPIHEISKYNITQHTESLKTLIVDMPLDCGNYDLQGKLMSFYFFIYFFICLFLFRSNSSILS